jgi:hypothetical protein
MTWKSYAVVSGGTLLVTYLFSAPPTIAPGRPPAVGRAVVTGSAPSTADIQQQAARLESRVRAETEYRPPARNPFRFGGRPAAVKPAVRAPEPVTDAPVVIPTVPSPPPPPPIRLTGILTNTVGGERQRSAVLNTPEGVITAREGEPAGAYRIVRVDEDAVEVVGPDGVTRRLNLRP